MITDNDALRALIEAHAGHGAFVGGNFIDCGRCRFHAHASTDHTAVEHDGDYTFTRTWKVVAGTLAVVAEERKAIDHYAAAVTGIDEIARDKLDAGPRRSQ